MQDEVSTTELAIRLGDGSEDVRLKACKEILKRGQETAPMLVRAIESELVPWEAHSFAHRTIAEIQPQIAGESPDALMLALEESETWDSCAAVSQALLNFGAASTAPLLALLTSGEKEIYPPAAHALAQIAKADPSIMPAVVNALRIGKLEGALGRCRGAVRRRASAAQRGDRALNSISKPEKNARTIAVLELFGAKAIPALLESLRSSDWRI